MPSSLPELPGIFQSLAPILDNYGYLAVGGLLFLEDFGVPVPGETIMIAAAIYAGAGRLNVVLVALVAFCAAVIGDNLGFVIGRFGGRALVDRWGRYVLLTAERLDRAQEFFERRGASIIVVARFIEGLRQANGIIAGISEMHWRRFLAFNALGAALWVGVWVTVGAVAGSHITAVYHAFTSAGLYGLVALVLLGLGFLALRHRRRAAARHALSPTPDAPTPRPRVGTSAMDSTEGGQGEPAVGTGPLVGSETAAHPPEERAVGNGRSLETSSGEREALEDRRGRRDGA